MPIERLCISKWDKTTRLDEDIDHPSWHQVETAIRRLNGLEWNDLLMVPKASNPETWLAVGGGAGKYVVTGSIDAERFPTVVKTSGSGLKRHREKEREFVMVGGQEGDYPSRMIVDLETALKAAQAFHATAEFGGGDVLWEDY